MAGAAGMLLLSGGAMAAGNNNEALNDLYGRNMDGCLNNLNMLKTINQTDADRQSAALNGVISGATHYLLMRGQLTQDMRSVMDNIWQSRLTGQCQSIHNALFEGLLNLADGGTEMAGAAGRRQP
ncbi:hypothetical protein GM31_20150 [Trabulsiella odontotermitis]|uniref:Uncharacterized protein n=2 Tax=Trabulsiella odontotermitis TaxID=379893 RepID=A0A0L0GXS2_9ENTR|nr:hypothetical protein GM31_20150 [Trabulsiella odontotermitis]